MNASAILASLARRLPRRSNSSLSLEAVPPFYLYDEPRLQFGWLLACERIVKLRHTSAWAGGAEVLVGTRARSERVAAQTVAEDQPRARRHELGRAVPVCALRKDVFNIGRLLSSSA